MERIECEKCYCSEFDDEDKLRCSLKKCQPDSKAWKNRKYRKFMLDGINNYMDTSFTADEIMEIYTYLGNACNHKKTVRFIESGYDMEVLRE